MPTRVRKVRKFRGSRTHGWGQVAQHRGAGRRGGRGKTGGHKHHWTRTVVYEPDRFGKHGFKRSWRREVTAINVGDLDEAIDVLMEKNLASKKEDGFHVNLAAIGVGKLLGGGRPLKPFIVEVSSCTDAAKRKIEEAKGRVIVLEK